jgi:hypothetical protein
LEPGGAVIDGGACEGVCQSGRAADQASKDDNEGKPCAAHRHRYNTPATLASGRAQIGYQVG